MNFNATILGQTLAFAVFVWFCMRYIWPPIMQALQERQDKISKGLSDAEQSKQQLQLAQQKSEELIKSSQQQANQNIASSNKQAQMLIEQAKQKSQIEAQKIINSAQDEVNLMAQKTRDSLRKELSSLTIATTEKLLAAKLDKKLHEDLLKDIIAKV